MKMVLAILCVFSAHTLMAHDLPITISSSIDGANKKALENALEEVSSLLPAKLKEGLPKNLVIKIEKLSDHVSIPSDVCTAKVEQVDRKKKIERPFVYGEYKKINNTLVLNVPVLNELVKGRNASIKIDCQHKSLYDQAISTIVHELTHAYDFNNQNISNSSEFKRRAGFKKGLLKTKTKNIEAMRSADAYELVNVAEAYAVNMEYFTMDSEYACRKPAMFEYFQRTLEVDPFPNRNCVANNTVMMSTSNGYFPTKLDPSRVYRVDYLLAAPGKDVSSGFGHSMFRIVLCAPDRVDPITGAKIPATPFGKKCLEDKLYHLVVSYRANVEDATLNYFKGLFGGYPSMLFILNFGDVLDEYNRDEFRDLVSYPLNLSAKEKVDFINKVLEEHWNYRGSYKFFTNNCAVESYDLLKGALERDGMDKYSSPSPKGVLEDLDQLEYVSVKSGQEELFPARTEQLLQSYSTAYGYKILKDTKKDKKALEKFVEESAAQDRADKFDAFRKTKKTSDDLHVELTALKAYLVRSSSFAVFEQQILRTKSAEFRKKASEMLMDAKNSKDDRIQKLVAKGNSLLSESFSDLTIKGYGVPLAGEMISRADIDKKVEDSKDTVNEIEASLKELMPKEIAGLDAIGANVSSFNQYSIKVRSEYRVKLDQYVHLVLTNLSHDDSGRETLARALTSTDGVNEVRNLLDKSLISEKEILDAKLRKLITDALN